MGTRDTGAYATFSEVVNYLDWLGSHFSESPHRRERLIAAGRAIHLHEKALTDRLLYGAQGQKGLSDMQGVDIIGGVNNPLREGLVSLTVKGKTAEEVVSILSEQGIRVHARKDDYFSGNILIPLNLKSCVRVSLCHYNSIAEVNRFLTAMGSIVL